MKLWTVAAGVCCAAVWAAGCDATARYRVLSIFFDGVPVPTAPEPPRGAPEEVAVQPRKVGYREHGPYGARLCNACHTAGTSNALTLPTDQICFQCHDIRLNKKYIHGPLASGGCLACHDPHSSQYRYLLLSDADTFCAHCHDTRDLAKVPAHGDGYEAQCTTCHDPHMSDKKYLLR
jgi:predicted CXXCH cytochrome family protein